MLSRSATQTEVDRTSTASSEETITLRIHPLFGQPILVLRRYGPDAVWAELQGRPVRLAPEAVRALAGWVTARLDRTAIATRRLFSRAAKKKAEGGEEKPKAEDG
jgi:hypothetical protein